MHDNDFINSLKNFKESIEDEALDVIKAADVSDDIKKTLNKISWDVNKVKFFKNEGLIDVLNSKLRQPLDRSDMTVLIKNPKFKFIGWISTGMNLNFKE